MTTDGKIDDGFLERFLSSAFSVAEPGDVESAGSDPEFTGDSVEDEPLPPTVGRFMVAGILGEGGSGRVLRAHDPILGRDVAVKLLRSSLMQDAAARDRFVAEAHVCAGLQHPGIVPIHEFGSLGDGRPYFAMKIVEGQTLAELMRGAERGAAGRGFVEIFEKVCQTLEYVHAHGVLHGDLKPHNIMVGAFGEVQVMDFGFARNAPGAASSAPRLVPVVGGDGSGLVRDGVPRTRIAGTLPYMAPEQANADDAAVSTRTDVFGLGAMLCEILTGAPPYRAKTRAELLLRASKAWLDDARERLGACEADRELVDLALRCIEVDPAKRPADAGEVARAVSAHLRSLSKRARAAELEAEKARAVAAHEARARRLTLGLAVAAVLAVIAPAALMLRNANERDERRGNAEHAVGAALERARLLADEARAAPVDAATPWVKAFEAAHAAVGLALGPDVGEPTRISALALEADVGREREQAAARAHVVARLAELRPHGRVEDPAQLDEAYRTTFASLDVDVGASDVDVAAERIRRDPVRDALVDALDEWTWVRRQHRTPDATAWRVPLRIALAADDDAFRNQVREALADDAPERLAELVASERLGDEAARSLALVARWLAATGAREEAIRVYRLASFRHPEDARLSHDLAAQLALLEDAPLEEIMRLYSMALAVAPDDTHVMTDLGRVLLLRGERSNSASMLGRVVALDPHNCRAKMLFGAALVQLGQFESSLEPLTAAIECGHPVAIVNLEEALTALGRVGEASDAMRLAVTGRRVESDLLTHCGARWLQMRDFSSSENVVDRVLAVAPDHMGALHVKTMVLLESGRFDDAVAAVERLEEIAGERGLSFTASDENLRSLVLKSRDVARDFDAVDEAGFDIMSPIEAAFVASTALRGGRIELAATGYEFALERMDDDARVLDFFMPAAIAFARMASAAPEGQRAPWRDLALSSAIRGVTLLRASVAERDSDACDFLRLFHAFERTPEFAAVCTPAGPGDAAATEWATLADATKAECVRVAFERRK